MPPDLLADGVRRLRVIALLYALAFFLAGFLPSLLFQPDRIRLFSAPQHWLPGTLSIVGALAVAGLTWMPGISQRAVLRVGLGFEILGSFGIAAAEFHDVTEPVTGFGLSWVAAWVLLFTVVIPARPRTSLLAAVASVAAVPTVFAIGTATGTNIALPPIPFFFSLVFPYVVIVLMAAVGSRVVYRLGAAVREARELGSYRLTERLGQGGMGEVWRAEHRLLARPAAIKLIRPEVLGAHDPQHRHTIVRRFEREAQATALLRSPHTMELYDFGVTDDGTFYYVMELLDGFDLDELVTRFGPVPPERAVHFLRQMCDSLGEAHATDLIHRDVKPANIYTCRYGRRVDYVKVLDFGLVKHSRRPEEGAEKLTADHMAGGTPAFIAPEQALGQAHVDGRADLYAVGCVAYWLLTGGLVFQGRTPMETMVMHIRAEPEPPSRRTELPIPPALDDAVLACLAKDPADRPQTADALLALLDRVPLAAPWTAGRAQQWWLAHRGERAGPPAVVSGS